MGDENPLLSIVVPGAAIHNPEMPVVVVNLTSKLAKLGLANANVKYCVPDRLVLRLGPTGKNPVDKSIA